MSKLRVRKMQAEIQRELGQILARDVQDPRLNLVSVLSVDLAADLSTAQVYISAGPAANEQERREVAAALDSAKGYLRYTLGQSLRARLVPELTFHIDSSIAEGMKMMRLIDRQIEEDTAAAADRPPLAEGVYKE